MNSLPFFMEFKSLVLPQGGTWSQAPYCDLDWSQDVQDRCEHVIGRGVRVTALKYFSDSGFATDPVSCRRLPLSPKLRIWLDENGLYRCRLGNVSLIFSNPGYANALDSPELILKIDSYLLKKLWEFLLLIVLFAAEIEWSSVLIFILVVFLYKDDRHNYIQISMTK